MARSCQFLNCLFFNITIPFRFVIMALLSAQLANPHYLPEVATKVFGSWC